MSRRDVTPQTPNSTTPRRRKRQDPSKAALLQDFDTMEWDGAEKESNSTKSQISKESAPREQYELHDDVYTMIFLSYWGGSAFWFGLSIFILKISLFVFIGIDLYQQDFDSKSSTLVRAAQFFMLPIALTIQQDLIATYALIANIEYHPSILEKCKDATKTKWILAASCRFVDGCCSLAVNFIILLISQDALSLFLNFAALAFLQTIDNLAFSLAKEGFLTDRIQDVAHMAMTLTLPQKHDPVVNAMDSVLFVCTYASMLATWIMVVLRQDE